MTETGYSIVESAPLRYLKSLPPGEPSSEAGWPLLCFLHGYDEAAPLGIGGALTRHGPLRTGSSPRAKREFIVVAPQLPRAGDIWNAYADAVRDIVVDVQRAHGGDPARTYLTGFSFGGNGVFDLATAQPGFWAALWPVDPTRVPHTDPGRPIWLSVGAAARGITPRFVRALDLKPVDADPTADRLYLDEGEDHAGSAKHAYRDERIYSWLLAQRSPPTSS